jgi:hypothetical protein
MNGSGHLPRGENQIKQSVLVINSESFVAILQSNSIIFYGSFFGVVLLRHGNEK